MKNSIKIIVIFLIVLSFIFGYFTNNIISSNKKIDEIDSLDSNAFVKDSLENQVSDDIEFNIDDFIETSQKIEKEFSMNDYTQILIRFKNINVVPNILAGRQDLEFGLYDRSKMLLYKNPLNKNIIILNMSAGKKGDDSSYWINSFGYTSNIFNSTEGIFSGSYDEAYSDSILQQYSFALSGITFHVTAITKNNGDDNILAISEIAIFSEQLIKFLTE